MRDLTEQKRAEAVLREREAGLRMAQQVGKVGSWERDFSSNRLTWSEETYRIFGADPKFFPQLIPEAQLHLGGLVLTNQQIIVLLTALALMILLNLFIYRTRTGKAMRAVSFNLDAAKLMGIDTDRIIALTFALGSALAAAGGILVSINIPGIGSAQMALSYQNGVLSASGAHDVNLGTFVFSSAAISISSTGSVSVSKTQGVDLPGIGNTQMTLAYANGVASASGSRSVSLGSFLFSDAAISVDSTGKITVSKQQSVNITGIGGVTVALGYANREVTANGTASIGVSVLGKSINFGSAAVHISSSGQVSVSASQGVNIGPIHYNVSISYENGSIKVHY